MEPQPKDFRTTTRTNGQRRTSPPALSPACVLHKGRTRGGTSIQQRLSQYKINPILAVKKPGGHVRVVSNLKSPKGQSFNECIPADRLEDWPVSMLTARNFAHMIVKAGRNALMSCSDMCDAYKMIPVCSRQRHLQSYTFCGALFIELKLEFGWPVSTSTGSMTASSGHLSCQCPHSHRWPTARRWMTSQQWPQSKPKKH